MTDEEIKNFMEEWGYEQTDDPHDAIFVMRDGSMVSGEYDPYTGDRGLDHNIMADVLDDQGIPNSDPEIWAHIHQETGMVRLNPELHSALVMKDQELTDQQQSVIKGLDAKVDVYVDPPETSMLERRREIQRRRQREVSR